MDDELISGLTTKDKSTFFQLREIILNDYGPKEAEVGQVYRFLKARDFDLQKAEDMLRKHIEWRKTTMESFKNFTMNEIQKKYFELRIITYTKEGKPVVYVDMGNVDFIGLLKSMKADDIIKGILNNCLELEQCLCARSEKLGKRIDKVVFVTNYENLSTLQVLNKKTIEFFLCLFRIYEANGPERLESYIAINASNAFAIGFNIAKPVIKGTTLSKFHIYGTGGWREHLLRIINAEDLPVFLGGKKTGDDGNPFCNALVPSGPVPKHLYFRSPERRLRGKDFVRKYIVKAHDNHYLDFDVNSTGSTIFWKFETEGGDISFGLLYHSYDQPECEKEIIPYKTVNAHLEIEEGLHVCDKSGIYILAFDNSYSRLTAKCIFCKVYIKNVDGTEIVITR